MGMDSSYVAVEGNAERRRLVENVKVGKNMFTTNRGVEAVCLPDTVCEGAREL